MSSMKAVRIHNYGGVEELAYEEAPCPVPGAGEVLIRVHATSVNPFDCAVRAGILSGWFNHTLPLTLGTDVSGIIAETGPGVNGFRPGDAVYARTGVYRDGAYAQYVVAAFTDVALKPPSLDDMQAAAIPHVCLTAWQALFELADLQPGQTALIHGAAGGVGHMAVQLAHLRGARVIGTGSLNLDFVRQLGVSQAIDYETTAFEDLVSGVDVVLDTIGGDTQARSWQVLKPGGILVSTVQAPSEEQAAAHGVRQAMVSTAPPIGQTLTQVAGLVAGGQLRPHVSAVLPLEEVKTAHGMIEGRHTRGKLVLKVG